MNRFFDPNSFLWRCFDRAADVLGLSLLWLICALPVVTAGAACTALYDAAVHCVRRGEPSPYGRFWRTLRREFWLSTLVWLGWGSLLLLAAAGHSLLRRAAPGSPGLMLAAGLYYVLMALPAGALCWLFPLLSRYSLGWRELNRTALRLWLAHLPSTLAMAALLWVCADLCAQLLLPACFLPCLLALAHSFFVERAFARHRPPD